MLKHTICDRRRTVCDPDHAIVGRVAPIAEDAVMEIVVGVSDLDDTPVSRCGRGRPPIAVRISPITVIPGGSEDDLIARRTLKIKGAVNKQVRGIRIQELDDRAARNM